MKQLYRRVLQKLRSYLVENLLVNDELIDELYSSVAISTTEKELIEQEKCNRDKLNRMLVSLSLSQKEDATYDCFKECLLKTKNEHVLDQINEEERLCLSELSSHDEATKELILKFFEIDKPETFTSHQEIEDVLLNDPISRTGSSAVDDILDAEWLKNLVISTFPDAKEGTRPTHNRNKKKKKKKKKSSQPLEVGFFGVAMKFLSDQDCKRERQESESSQCSDIEPNDVNDIFETEIEPCTSENFALSVEDFYLWIKGVLEEHSGDLEAAEKFKQDEIDSSVFEELSPDELISYLPKLGQRKKVAMMWKDRKATLSYASNSDKIRKGPKDSNDQKQYQPLRQFESPATYKYKYIKGAYVTDIEKRSGNPLIPVHKFYDFKAKHVNTPKDATAMAFEVVKFGAACMNDRTNGTIHFGIKSTGEIIGNAVDSRKVERAITKLIRQSFYDGQVSIALNCIRPPQFIEVIGDETEAMNLFVIEIDVVSSSKFVEDFAFFLKATEENQPQSLLYRYDGDMKLLDHRDLDMFMKQEKNKLLLSRKEFEAKIFGNSNRNRNKVLQDFLCCGDEYFEQTIYPILLLHDMHNEAKGELHFLKYINWRAIFDFNKNGNNDGPQRYLEEDHGLVFNTNFIEEFDPRKVDKSQVHQVIDNLKNTSLPNWIYCNGSDEDYKEDPTDWKMSRSSSFRKAIDFYENNCPPERARVLIPVFSSESKLLIEAAEELFIRFQGKCLVITESETVSCILRDALHRRNVFPQKSNIDDFFVIGLPWKQVSEAVCRFVPAVDNADDLEVPRSTGVPVVLPLKFKRELCDLEVLASNECSELKVMSDEEKDEHRTTNGENFYRGGMVSWQNFYFSDQVLVRDIQYNLEECVRYVVKGGTQSHYSVPHVIIYHQPGAGGSTTSRQLLWTMRNMYRCCIVRSVTRQTVEQINRFRIYGEDNNEQAKPVLVLVDLDDYENVARLKDDLITESQKHSCDVFCVMIICCRVYEPPMTGAGASVLLKQHLTDSELEWFKEKDKHLTERHKHNKGCDPNTLLSFNLMKENFKMDNIPKLVARYVRDPNLTTEHRTLLKYLAFLNHYDINFQAVPANSFDPIMSRIDWLNHIPQSLKVLVNHVKINGVSGFMPCIRIANYLLSKTVLLELSTESGESTFTIGEVAIELLGSKIINPNGFAEHNKKFEKILANISKKREFPHSGQKPRPFSLLIMELLDRNDHDKAIDIVDKTYCITDDPMVAQQLARLHAEFGNWEDAHRSIELAMKQKHNHSYLTHTCGQVYKMEFESICKESKNNFDNTGIIQIVQIAQKSQFYFRQSQRISRLENVTPQDPAGFDGEIRLAIDVLQTLHLLDVIRVCESNKHTMPYVDNIRDCICKFMNGLPQNALDAIQILQTDIYTMKTNNFPLQNDKFLTRLASGKLDSYKHKLESAWHRSKQRNQDVKPSIQSFIDAMHAEESTLIDNVKSLKTHPNESIAKIRVFLASSVELYLRNSQLFEIDTEKVLKLSRHLFEMLLEANPTCTLEAHLMIVALHWPLESKASLQSMLCPHSLLINALTSWQRIIDEKPSKQKHVDKITFFISKSDKFPCLIKAENINKDNVATLKGKVCSNGQEFEIKPYGYRTRNIPAIKIPALNQIRMSSMWHKETDVVVGFGLYGPKADLLENVASFRTCQHSPRTPVVTKGSLNHGHHQASAKQVRMANRKTKNNQTTSSQNMTVHNTQYAGYGFPPNLQLPPRFLFQHPPPYMIIPPPNDWSPPPQQRQQLLRTSDIFQQRGRTNYRSRPRK